MSDDTEKPDSPLGGLAWQALVMAAMSRPARHGGPMTIEEAEAFAAEAPSRRKREKKERGR
jgi:hypothetical protein